MRLALREAERAGEAGDVPIGAVVVHEGEVVGAAGNERELRADPTAHAEVLALREAAQGARRLARSRLGPLRDARAVRDVRGGDRARPRPARRLSAPPTRRPAPRAACSTSSASRASTTARRWTAGLLAGEAAALLRDFSRSAGIRRRGRRTATPRPSAGHLLERSLIVPTSSNDIDMKLPCSWAIFPSSSTMNTVRFATLKTASRRRRTPSRQLGVRVGEERRGQAVLALERFLRRHALGRDADERGAELGHLVRRVAIGAELLRAGRRVITGIEEEDDALAAVLRQRERALRPLEGEIRAVSPTFRLMPQQAFRTVDRMRFQSACCPEGADSAC